METATAETVAAVAAEADNHRNRLVAVVEEAGAGAGASGHRKRLVNPRRDKHPVRLPVNRLRDRLRSDRSRKRRRRVRSLSRVRAPCRSGRQLRQR